LCIFYAQRKNIKKGEKMMVIKYRRTLLIACLFFTNIMNANCKDASSYAVSQAEMRRLLAVELSNMFSREVSEYDQFKKIVQESNESFLQKNPHQTVDAENRVMAEKHGAIRVGTACEMRMVTRIFSVFGMYPVGFYDLTQLPKGALPMIATAFRPIDESIEVSAFRMFCSMLHPAYIKPAIQEDVMQALEHRGENNPKFSEKLKTLLALAEEKGLTHTQLKEFVTEVVNAFRINRQKPVRFDLYKALRKENDVFADIVCLGININHLTPRVYDIDDATYRLQQAGIPMKDGGIEGPPLRNAVPILLNQTSRKAPGEPLFVSNDKAILDLPLESPQLYDLKKTAPKLVLKAGETVHEYLDRIQSALELAPLVEIEHKARFGEIEARGVALTPKGEALYHTLLATGRFQTEYPQTHTDLFAQGLAYYRLHIVDQTLDTMSIDQENIYDLVEKGSVKLIPLTYEDFLATSAAGIFTSNLSSGVSDMNNAIKSQSADNQILLEQAMGRPIIDRHELCRTLCL
jgi:uncharacterized glyoxalase superfamily metalloenzyme YdcJ